MLKHCLFPTFTALPILAAVFLSPADSTAGQGPRPNICDRPCWSAVAPSGGISQMATLNRAIIHHTADANHFNTSGLAASKANVKAVQLYHMNSNGWSDIAYHYLVDKFGNIFEGRSGSNTSLPKGSHDGTNTNSFGFNIMGYFHGPHNQTPTTAMLDSLYDVIAWRMPSAWSPYGGGAYGTLGVTVGYLDGHRRVKATACPGDIAYNNYITTNLNGGDARNGVNARKAGGTGSGSTNRVGIARGANGQGYWIAAADGGVFSFGPGAPFYGSMGGTPLSQPVVGIASRPQGDGYWLVAKDGGIFCFGAAGFHGSVPAFAVINNAVGIASTSTGNGYWVVASDGGIFSFGDAPFHGSLGGQGYNDIKGMAPDWGNNRNGYWLVRATGHIYSYGTCCYHGGGEAGNSVVGIASKSDGGGYWQTRNNGSIYSYGALNYCGGANELTFVGICPGPSTWNGYWLVKNNGAVFSFGDAAYYGGAN